MMGLSRCTNVPASSAMFFTESGLCAGCGYVYPLDGRRIRCLGERIAKGLYYHAHGYPLPARADISVHLLVGNQARHQVEVMRQMGAQVLVLGTGGCVIMSVEAREGAKEATFVVVILYTLMALIVSTRDEPGTVSVVTSAQSQPRGLGWVLRDPPPRKRGRERNSSRIMDRWRPAKA